MKTKLLIFLSVLILLSIKPANAATTDQDNGGAIIADVLIARPLCLAATAVGSVAFVLALPFAAMTHGVNRAGNALVVTPAKATFTRPLGDFDSLKD